MGGLLGGGFYKYENIDAKFGINYGLVGDFMLSQNMSVGTELRYHNVFDAANVWNIFLTFNVSFSTGDGW